jgi:hypothetical protein
MERLPNIIAPSDNRVPEVNTQRLRPSQALRTLNEISGRKRKISNAIRTTPSKLRK